MAPAADYLILKRRAQEENRRQYEQICKSNFKAGANAEWEIKTAGFIEHQKAQLQGAAPSSHARVDGASM